MIISSRNPPRADLIHIPLIFHLGFWMYVHSGFECSRACPELQAEHHLRSLTADFSRHPFDWFDPAHHRFARGDGRQAKSAGRPGPVLSPGLIEARIGAKHFYLCDK